LTREETAALALLAIPICFSGRIPFDFSPRSRPETGIQRLWTGISWIGQRRGRLADRAPMTSADRYNPAGPVVRLDSNGTDAGPPRRNSGSGHAGRWGRRGGSEFRPARQAGKARRSRHALQALWLLVFCGPRISASAPGEGHIAKWHGDAQCAITLSFDDVNFEHFEAARILEEYGFRGTFFVDTAHIYNSWYRDNYLQMHLRGHEIASHSVTHPRMNESMPLDEMVYEIWESKRYLEELTGVPCVSFAYPYGDHCDLARELAAQAYISSRALPRQVNAVNEFADLALLGINNFPTDYWGGTWTQEGLLACYGDYVRRSAALNGWGIEQYHHVCYAHTGVTPPTLRTHLAQLASGALCPNAWVAPQGSVARYYEEWRRSQLRVSTVSSDTLIASLSFDGDTSLLNFPLTILTEVPSQWHTAFVRVWQGSLELPWQPVGVDPQVIAYDALTGRFIYAIGERLEPRIVRKQIWGPRRTS